MKKPKAAQNAMKEDVPAVTQIQMRSTVSRKVRYVKQANREGLKLSEWMSRHLDADTADEIHKGKRSTPVALIPEVYRDVYDQCGGFVEVMLCPVIWEACRNAILNGDKG
ncbi:hypothetical protein J4732_15505 [Serratia marcescens]|uniref:Uncharacterized protein n=1 Tax=Serratia marcescens TaxID=615 RepID=A0A939NPD9_SERMA|nr:hypothetical protein [Serratia marcescens]